MCEQKKHAQLIIQGQHENKLQDSLVEHMCYRQSCLVQSPTSPVKGSLERWHQSAKTLIEQDESVFRLNDSASYAYVQTARKL